MTPDRDRETWLAGLEAAWVAAPTSELHATKRTDSSLTTCRVTTDPTGEDNSQVIAVTSTSAQASLVVAAVNNLPELVFQVREGDRLRRDLAALAEELRQHAAAHDARAFDLRGAERPGAALGEQKYADAQRDAADRLAALLDGGEGGR